jgi:hypothetical protein
VRVRASPICKLMNPAHEPNANQTNSYHGLLLVRRTQIHVEPPQH